MLPPRPAPATVSVIVALGTVYIVWGSTYLAIAYVVETLPPFLAAGARFLVAGLLLGAFVIAQDRWRRGRGASSSVRRPRWVEWRTALIVGSLLLLGGNGMVMVAEQTIPSGIAAVMIATTPIWMSLFDAAVTRRRPSVLAVGGLLVGMAGVVILLVALEVFGELLDARGKQRNLHLGRAGIVRRALEIVDDLAGVDGHGYCL